MRRGQRLGKHDRLFTWHKPAVKPRYLPNPLWKRVPEELAVRVLRFTLTVTVDATVEYSQALVQARSQKAQRELGADLLAVIVEDQVPERPGRCEPRAVKRRPKPYPLLNKPRRQFKEIPRRSRYRKNDPQK